MQDEQMEACTQINGIAAGMDVLERRLHNTNNELHAINISVDNKVSPLQIAGPGEAPLPAVPSSTLDTGDTQQGPSRPRF